MSLSVACADRFGSDVDERLAAVVTASPVFLVADFAITIYSRVNSSRFGTCRAARSGRRRSQTTQHVPTLRKRQGFRDGFLAGAEQVLVRTGNGVQDVDDRPFEPFLSDDNVAVVRSRACSHRTCSGEEGTNEDYRLRPPLGERTVSSVW
jgi:hypothetical protein